MTKWNTVTAVRCVYFSKQTISSCSTNIADPWRNVAQPYQQWKLKNCPSMFWFRKMRLDDCLIDIPVFVLLFNSEPPTLLIFSLREEAKSTALNKRPLFPLACKSQITYNHSASFFAREPGKLPDQSRAHIPVFYSHCSEFVLQWNLQQISLLRDFFSWLDFGGRPVIIYPRVTIWPFALCALTCCFLYHGPGTVKGPLRG